MDDHAEKMREAERLLEREKHLRAKEKELRVHQNHRLLKLLKEERKLRQQYQASFLAARAD